MKIEELNDKKVPFTTKQNWRIEIFNGVNPDFQYGQEILF